MNDITIIWVHFSHVSRVTQSRSHAMPGKCNVYKSQYSNILNEHCCTIIYVSSIKGQRPPTKYGQWLCMFDINWEFANISLISVGSAAVLAPHLSIVSTSALPSSDFRPYATPTHKWFCIYIFTQLSRFVLNKPKDFIVKLREREGQRVDLGRRSLKGHL